VTSAFVIGPGKSGTTLMISLLDNHPDLSVIPLEIKFYHGFNTLRRNSSYDHLNQFFMFNTKISLLDPQSNLEPDVMNEGYVDFSNVDFHKFREAMNEKVKDNKETSYQQSLLPSYIKDLHQAYAKSLNRKGVQGFALKEGCHGLPYIDKMRKDFTDAKFIVMVRDPRDIFYSYRSIAAFRQKGNLHASFGSHINLFHFLFGDYGTSILSYMEYFNTTKNDDSVIFVRYEDLVENVDKEMYKVSKFLGINFSKTMLEPTNAGTFWGGNSSSGSKLDKVVKSQKNKWSNVLSREEVILLEFFLSDYFKKNDYPKTHKNISIIRCLLSVRFSQFGKPRVKWKDFLLPYVRISRHIYMVVFCLCSMFKRIIFQK
jgi:hypothetical protein